MVRNLRIAALLTALVPLASCSYVTKEELQVEADSCRRTSQQALAAANDAKAQANEALEQARESFTVSQKTEEVVNRSYKKSMYK